VTEWQSNNKIPNEASATIVVVVLHFTYIRLKNGQNFLLLKKEKRGRKKMKGKVAFNYKFCQWISFQKRKEVDFFSFFWTKNGFCIWKDENFLLFKNAETFWKLRRFLPFIRMQ
jgi:hypothetical protein